MVETICHRWVLVVVLGDEMGMVRGGCCLWGCFGMEFLLG